jgi:hypothetical protein
VSFRLFFDKYHARFKTDDIKQNAEILILGSSRVFHNIDCKLLTEITNKRCYNLGFDGALPKDIYAAMQLYLSQNTCPKLILIQVDHHSKDTGSRSLSKVNFFKNKLLFDPVLKKYFEPDDLVFRYIPLFYNLKYPALSWREIYKTILLQNKKSFDKYGFKPINTKYTSIKKHDIYNVSNEWQENKWLLEIENILRVKNTKIVYFTAPYLDKVDLTYNENSNRMYWNFSELFKGEAKFFVDDIHLNEKGANYFTNELSTKINHAL